MDKIIISQLNEIIKNENDNIANMANASALLMQTVNNISWVGFYRYIHQNDELILGPYQGKIACVHIPNKSGVCGTALNTGKTQRVKDVNDLKNHIACDEDSQSEIVIPLFNNNKNIIGVLDIDSNQKNRFKKEDQNILEEFCEVFTNNIDNLSNND